MRGDDVRIGSAYVCRVSGELCRVEIVRELFARRGRKFSAMNCRTGRTIEVSAARLSYLPGERPARVVVTRERVAMPHWPDYVPVGTEDIF